jgi:hypothetical protein
MPKRQPESAATSSTTTDLRGLCSCGCRAPEVLMLCGLHAAQQLMSCQHSSQASMSAKQTLLESLPASESIAGSENSTTAYS